MSPDFTVIGRALAAPARSTMLSLLMEGNVRPAGELAHLAGVGAPAASEHLAVLLDAGLVRCTVTGRQRWFGIASPEVAAAIEHIGRLCPTVPVRSLRRSREQSDLAQARMCYDHLAGRVGVELADSFLRRGWLETAGLVLTPAGADGVSDLGVDIASLEANRRPLTRPCLDWTERRPHVAGSVGAAIAGVFQSNQWVRRRERGRGLILTASGAAALAEKFDIRLPRTT